MKALKLYAELCDLLLYIRQIRDPSFLPEFEPRFIRLRGFFLCGVCEKLVVNPFKETIQNCEHPVCKEFSTCIKYNGADITPKCSKCVSDGSFTEDLELKLTLDCYIHLCHYLTTCSFFRNNLSKDFFDVVTEDAKFTNDFPITCFSPYESKDIHLPKHSTSGGKNKTGESNKDDTFQENVSVLDSDSRSENSSPEILIDTVELKKQRNCSCDEQPTSKSCVEVNCPCYLSYRGCFNCCCQDCENPANSASYSPVRKIRVVQETAAGFKNRETSEDLIFINLASCSFERSSQSPVGYDLVKSDAVSPLSNRKRRSASLKSVETENVMHKDYFLRSRPYPIHSEIKSSRKQLSSSSNCESEDFCPSEPLTSGSKSKAGESNENGFRQENASVERLLMLNTSENNAKSSLSNKSETSPRSPLLNCTETNVKSSVLDYREMSSNILINEANLKETLLEDRGSGEKPALILTCPDSYSLSDTVVAEPNVSLSETRVEPALLCHYVRPNAELLRRCEEMAKKLNAVAAADPIVATALLNPPRNTTIPTDIITLD